MGWKWFFDELLFNINFSILVCEFEILIFVLLKILLSYFCVWIIKVCVFLFKYNLLLINLFFMVWSKLIVSFFFKLILGNLGRVVFK